MKTSSDADLPNLLNNEFTDLKKEGLALSREHLNLHDRTTKTPKYRMYQMHIENNYKWLTQSSAWQFPARSIRPAERAGDTSSKHAHFWWLLPRRLWIWTVLVIKFVQPSLRHLAKTRVIWRKAESLWHVHPTPRLYSPGGSIGLTVWLQLATVLAGS